MIPYTFFDSLKTVIAAMVWPGTTNKIIGDNVHIVVDTPEILMSRFQPPSVFIKDTGGKPHHNHPYIIEQKFTLGFFIENVANAFGDNSILGSNRAINTSKGAGILSVENEIFGQILKITNFSSVPIRIMKEGKAPTSSIKGASPAILRVWSFSVVLSFF